MSEVLNVIDISRVCACVSFTYNLNNYQFSVYTVFHPGPLTLGN